MGLRRTSLAFLALLSLVGCGGEDGRDETAIVPLQIATSEIVLHNDLGEHHRRITTSSETAQTYFDQGLRLQYAFDHPDAIQSYKEALKHDPECAMCWWGIALAAGPDFNTLPPTDQESADSLAQSLRLWRARLAHGAIQKAELLSEEIGVEADLIGALATRYAEDATAERAPLDTLYAHAMEEVASRHPDDADVVTLYAAALMNLNPWNYWNGPWGNRTARPGTERILSSLERAIELNPNHPGACHYYIHAVEAAYPEKAIGCADRLAGLMPGAGHIVHMPGHIYIRVGRYYDAVTANEHAVHGDGGRAMLCTGACNLHNYDFMAFAATMAGMSEKALDAARIVASQVTSDVADGAYGIQNAVVLPQLTLVTFGRWEEVLNEPVRNEGLGQATALSHYARGVALAALDRFDEARREQELLADAAAAIEGGDTNAPVAAIARHALAGELTLRSGHAKEAVGHFRAAADIEDRLAYDEPPPLWYYPIRQSLGRALLEAGWPADAEKAYREDLSKFPNNGWSLYGLALSLKDQGRDQEAVEAMARFDEAWQHADVQLSASRF
jgi:tetratricopeptide (TPR) repeat protein